MKLNISLSLSFFQIVLAKSCTSLQQKKVKFSGEMFRCATQSIDTVEEYSLLEISRREANRLERTPRSPTGVRVTVSYLEWLKRRYVFERFEFHFES